MKSSSATIQALQYRRSVPRYLLMKAFGKSRTAAHLSRLAPLSLCTIPAPKLPGEEWVQVAPIIAGICGSDISTLTASGSPYFAAVTSMPFVMGHEVVGRVREIGKAVTGVAVGDRVVLKPALGCRVRGITPPCQPCASGADALCHNITRGVIAPGIQTGYCRDTGGAWSERFVAHESQLYVVPDCLSDVAAALVEPFACAIHAALRTEIAPGARVFVLGCGAVGLLTIAALRATGCTAEIITAPRHPHQQKLATLLGATTIMPSPAATRERYQAWREVLGAEVIENEIGKPMVIGGANVTFDCVASGVSIDDAIRFTDCGGELILVGMPGVPKGIDWTPLWYKELTLRAAYTYGTERAVAGETDTFRIALNIMAQPEWQEKLTALTSEPYPLDQYWQALTTALHTGQSRTAKTLLRIAPK